MRAVVTGLIASFPLGGLAWHYVQYLLGLRALGWDVLYLEDTGRWSYDPERGTYVEEASGSVGYLAEVMGRFGLDDQWALRWHDGTHYGLGRSDLERACRNADVLLNVSGSCWLRPQYREIRRTVYIDTDPGYDQIKGARVARGEGHDEDRYSVARIHEHDHHFTFGESVGTIDSAVPDDGIDWRPTRQPIVLDLWRPTPSSANTSLTTVLSWQAHETPLEWEGRRYTGKEGPFRKVMSLPCRTSLAFELAIAGDPPTSELRKNGWRVVDALEVSRTMEQYARYIDGSLGEFSVAKDVYVEMRTGWFSERSACYLASGRPVVLQDTGFGDHLPTGEGLLGFTDLESAIEAIEELDRDRQRHGDAARAIAEEYFASERVLGSLLERLAL